MGLYGIFTFSFIWYYFMEMKVLKWITLISIFGVVIYKLAFMFGFFIGVVKSFLSYFCAIGVSWPAVAEASSWLFFMWLFAFGYFSYVSFFR